MPRKVNLTWQPGTGGRAGRWRKKYKGRVVYLPFGRSKSDVEGYKQALKAFKHRKTEIDAEQALQPKPNQAEYEKAVEDWTHILHWSLEHGDADRAQLARDKVESLRFRLAQSHPTPLGFHDLIQSLYDIPPEVLAPLEAAWRKLTGEPISKVNVPPSPHVQEILDMMDGSPARIQREVWRDRIESQRRKYQNTSDTIESCVEDFLTSKRAKVKIGDLSAGRCDALRVHLHHFRDWIGARVSVKIITGKIIFDYHTELVNGIADARLSADYAKDHFGAMKSFVRWLWRTDRIELPRDFDSKDLTISKKVATPKVFTKDEIAILLAAATGRTKLYLLLMLNAGMTQKDISDLQASEVDWTNGTITRKRSKTQDYEDVPTVKYILWKETFRLLSQERAKEGTRVLLNADGGPLKVEVLSTDNKLQKIDNIASAFNRLRRATKITKPSKLFRKTSASFLRSNKEFAGVEVLFLGHAPASTSDRHYTLAPQKLLDEAVAWLGTQYKLS
jgi:integrase